MREDYLLLNPGPVPIAREVREAMAEPMVYHRSPGFKEVYARAVEGVEHAFTHATPDGAPTASGGVTLLLQGTASMGMEAAVTNLVDRDGEVLALENGAFGRKFAGIADRHASATRAGVDWGDSFDLDAIRETLTDDVDVVTMVHTETSTGLRNPVAEVGELAREHDALFVVDAVSTVGGDEFRIDDWYVDVAITAGQKALGGPPGISALYANERALDAIDGGRTTLYGDLDRYVSKAADDSSPCTTAVPLVRALAAAGEAIREEGMPARIARHRRRAAAVRDGVRAMGLDLFSNVEGPTEYANTVTAVFLPESVQRTPDSFFEGVLKRGVSVASGHAHLGDRVFRISNMGDLEDDDLLRGLRAVGESLTDAGAGIDTDAGLDVARNTLQT